MAHTRSFITALCVYTTILPILGCGVVGRPIVIRDTAQIDVPAAHFTSIEEQSIHPMIFAQDAEFAGPGGDGPSGVNDDSLNAGSSMSIILDAAACTEATASSPDDKSASTFPSTTPTSVTPLETYEPKITAPSIPAINIELKLTASTISSSNGPEMPVTVVPVQPALQKLEQMTSMSLSDEIITSSNDPDATIDPILKGAMHTLQAPWHTSSSSPSDSLLFNKGFQVLIIALLLLAALVVAVIICLLCSRSRRARAEAAARAAIGDDAILSQDTVLEEKKSVEGISDYQRGSAPAGLEMQLKVMKENKCAPESPKPKIETVKWCQGPIYSTPKYHTHQQLAKSEMASFVEEQQEDDLCSVTDYYFESSPTETSYEAKPDPPSLWIVRWKTRLDLKIRRSVLSGVAKEIIPGVRLYRPLWPSPLRHSFVEI